MVPPYVKRELSVYGGVVAAVVVAVAVGASYLAAFPVRYVLLPLLIGTLFVGGILAGASDSGPGIAAEGNVSGESGGSAELGRGDFTPGRSEEGVVPSIRSRSVVFLLFGVALWSFVGLVATVALA
ncbi:hypothetical protein SAMN04487948_11275 [Halogranum amylolyticum]|uniref:Uncharacterized protein n=1 Tax=Halogranum amylolyticum TaxID=660520 RepID=A0A1H8US13_9EURY|nr:hypothetical protein [Halogranum amylolyticum]SEP05982.1 hypothetical protein SAMN04487948_11275 [Halogranum amylolyticum]